jgi:spectinomycin phosphotransferase
MRSRPIGLDEDRLARALSHGWGLEAPALAYAPVGGGSYHWTATERDGTAHFVTVDDLDRKPWLGSTRDTTFQGLRRSFDTAVALHRDAGLAFVVAPRTDTAGASVRRLDQRYSVAVFPSIDGRSGAFDEPLAPEDRLAAVGMLAALHEATPIAVSTAPHRGFELPGRGALEDALAHLGSPWTSGPFGEPVRHWLSSNARPLLNALATYDELADRVAVSARLVITHGEPHPGNLMRAGGALLLVDWDTVALAPPERDIWLLDRDSTAVRDLYHQATGRRVDEAALELYPLAWTLTDVAIFTAALRAPHDRTADAEHAWTALSSIPLT